LEDWLQVSAGSLIVRSTLFLLVAVPSFAQVARYEGKQIARIEYQPSEQPLAAADLARFQTLSPNEPFRASEVATVIDALFATGRYSDIQVDVRPEGDRIVVRFITQQTDFIGHVDVLGKIANPPDRAQLVSAARLDLGAPFRPELLDNAQKQIEQLFVANGLYEAKATLDTSEDPHTQQVSVNLMVDPGYRAHYQSPAIHGDTRLPDQTIIKATGWRVRFISRWRQVTESLTNTGIQGVQRRYQKDDRLTASVALQGQDYDPGTRRVQPQLEIQAGPKVQIKAVEAKVSKKVLQRYVPVFQEGAVEEDLLVEGARNLKDYFQSQGYPDADVTFRRLPVQNDELTIEYVITQGTRQKLTSVAIHGNRYFSTDTIRERMFLQPSSFRLRRGRFSDAFRRKDQETITSLYRENGFRDVNVSSQVETNYGGKSGQIGVTITINEGAQWTVSNVTLEGAPESDEQTLLGLIASSAGQPYSDVSIAADRAAIVNFYRSEGYLNAAVDVSPSPAAAPQQVLLAYRISPGEQRFVRDILFSGLKATRLSYVKNNLFMDNQGPLSFTALRDSQRHLYDLGAFASVQAAVQNPGGTEAYKYVLLDFDEGRRYALNVGVGAQIARIGGTTSNLTAPAGSTGFSPRVSIDLKRLNQWGLNHTIALQTIASTIEKKAALSYLWPRFQNTEGRSVTFTALYDDSRDVTTFSSRREEASIQVSQKLSKPTTILFRYAYRRVTTNDVVIPALLVPQLLQPVRLGIVSASLVQDRRDNSADAHRGLYNTLDVAVTSKVFGSQRSFLRIVGKNATYYPLTRNITFARQTTFGAILPFATPAGLSETEAVPLPERLFGGGNVTLRGFPENQAGPRDLGTPAGPGGTATSPTGFPLGGNALFFNTFELRFPLLGENINGVIFHDMGNVFHNLSSLSFRVSQRNLQDFDYMVHAVGFGIRYKTPVGPIRLDLAYSINPPSFVGFKGTLNELLQCNPNIPADQLPSACRGQTQNISHFQFFFSIGQTF
jgi:outer membrane protein assembly complex protein YaeT